MDEWRAGHGRQFATETGAAPIGGTVTKISAVAPTRYDGDSSVTLLPEPGFDSYAQSSDRRSRPSGSIVMVVLQWPLAVSPAVFSCE